MNKASFLFRFLKLFSGLGCCLAFLILAFNTLTQFQSGGKIVVPKIQRNPEGLHFPAVTICNESGFAGVGLYTDLDVFLNDTLNYEDVFHSSPIYHSEGGVPDSKIVESFTQYNLSLIHI